MARLNEIGDRRVHRLDGPEARFRPLPETVQALLPGVDGDVVLYTFTKEAMRDFKDAISVRTREAGCEFVSVTEDAFARILAQPLAMPR
jgi:hypothetical protein